MVSLEDLVSVVVVEEVVGEVVQIDRNLAFVNNDTCQKHLVEIEVVAVVEKIVGIVYLMQKSWELRKEVVVVYMRWYW